MSSWQAEAHAGKVPISGKTKSATGALRREPGKAGQKIASLRAGTEVTTIASVTTKKSAWVSVVGEGDKRGWVSEALVSHGGDKIDKGGDKIDGGGEP